jgi:TonB family protein
MKYPPKALEEKPSEMVLLQLLITEKGKVKDISVLNAADPDFVKEAIRLVKKSSGKWIPATHNGKKIADTKNITVQFNPEYAPMW